tara:strand:- start:8965 stop:9606 length:642 start_codon:yes stop_codon:yes gene_type:complete
MNNIPSYAIQMKEETKRHTTLLRSRSKTVELPYKRDEFLEQGLIEWSVGYGKENTVNTFTRKEYESAMIKVVANASAGGIKSSGLAPEPNLTGVKNAMTHTHVLGRLSPNAGVKVSMLFHCLAKHRRSMKSSAKKQANADALTVAQTTKTSVTFDVVPMGEKKKVKAHSEHAGVKQAIRAYCRVKWGSDWHADATLKTTRMAEATKALYNPNI